MQISNLKSNSRVCLCQNRYMLNNITCMLRGQLGFIFSILEFFYCVFSCVCICSHNRSSVQPAASLEFPSHSIQTPHQSPIFELVQSICRLSLVAMHQFHISGSNIYTCENEPKYQPGPQQVRPDSQKPFWTWHSS